MDAPIPLKQCIDCKEFFPQTSQYFYASYVNKDGWMPRCISCRSAYMSARYAQLHPKPEKLPCAVGHRICIRCEEPKPLNKVNFQPRRSGFSGVCRECMNKRDVERYHSPKPRVYAIPPEQKICIKCGVSKKVNAENFMRKANCNDGFFNVCRQCMYQRETERIHKRYQEIPPTFDESVLKECLNCNQFLPATPQYFDRNKRKADGLDINCKACHKERGKAYRLQHADEVQWRTFMYKEANREHIREQGRAYTKAHLAEQNARWRARDEQIKQNGGMFTASDVQKQYATQEGKCYWCHDMLVKYHIDHIIPVKRGGSDDPSNIVLTCPFCNQSKGSKTVAEWMLYLERFILPKKLL